jgi:hypothetical protein
MKQRIDLYRWCWVGCIGRTVFSEENVERVTTGSNLLSQADLSGRLTTLINVLAAADVTTEAAEEAFNAEVRIAMLEQAVVPPPAAPVQSLDCCCIDVCY